MIRSYFYLYAINSINKYDFQDKKHLIFPYYHIIVYFDL